MTALSELADKMNTTQELWLTTQRPGNGVATFPLWFIHDGERLYVLSAESSSEVWDVKSNPSVEVAIGDVDSTDRLAMTADIMDDPNWVPMMLGMLEKKYGDGDAERMARTAEAAKGGHVIIKLKPR
jgi:general stress protein 26